MLFCSVIAIAQAPTFKANQLPINKNQEVLTRQFRNYQIFQLPISDIHQQVSKSDRADFSLTLNSQLRWDFQINAHDIRSEKYRSRTNTSAGIVENKRQKNIT